MSLKTKLEAVIYATEEPVTLAQLASIFAAEALEWKAEQSVVSADAASEPVDESDAAGDATPPLLEAFDYPRQEPAELEAGPEAIPVDSAEISPSPTGAETPNSETDPVGDARRQARLRDREVRAIIRQLLDELIADYSSDTRGVEIREIAGGYRMATKPECHDAVRMFVKSLKPPLKLSLPALETLAVVAYKQPVTAPEVNEIRGVDSSGVFGSLLARKLIATAGRKPVIGRPILYKTTKEFLLRFGLKDVTELPSMEEFEKMAAMELDEPELIAEAEVAREVREDLSLELDAAQREEDAAAVAEGLEEEASTAAAETRNDES